MIKQMDLIGRDGGSVWRGLECEQSLLYLSQSRELKQVECRSDKIIQFFMQ